GMKRETRKAIFRALATAVLLPGGLVAVLAAALLMGVLLTLTFWIVAFRAGWEWLRDLERGARTANEQSMSPASQPLPPLVRVREGQRFWGRGSDLRN
ncbi:MAG: hypothetical protein ACREB3_07245, partial [Burkholderiales bacterium]